MAKGKITRDNKHRVVQVDKYLLGDKSDPYPVFKVEYDDNYTPSRRRIELGKYATITPNEDGSYTYTPLDNTSEPRIVTDVTVSHLRGAVTYNDPYVKRWLRDEYQEVSLEDKPSLSDQGYAAFVIVILLLFGGPLGWLIAVPYMIGMAADEKIRGIRQKRYQLMDRMYNAFYKLKG